MAAKGNTTETALANDIDNTATDDKISNQTANRNAPEDYVKEIISEQTRT